MRGKVVNFVTRRLLPDAIAYPTALRRRSSGAGSPPTIATKGDVGALNRKLIGFFCSVHCPGNVILKTYDLARTLRDFDVTLIGGFQSPMEREFLDLVLRGSASVAVCPARGLGKMRIPKGWRNSLTDGRLLLLSFFDDNIRRPTAAIAAKRNAYVAALAHSILIAHAEKNSKTAKLCSEALAAGKPVFALDSPDNTHLFELGAMPVPANDPARLLAAEINHSD